MAPSKYFFSVTLHMHDKFLLPQLIVFQPIMGIAEATIPVTERALNTAVSVHMSDPQLNTRRQLSKRIHRTTQLAKAGTTRRIRVPRAH